MTQHQAEQLVVKWQKLLRLEDWDIEVRLKTEINSKGWLGCVAQQPFKWAAIITLKSDKSDDEIESTLVHEMVHIVLSGLAYLVDNEMKINLVEEQAVHKLATCLMLLYGNQKPSRKKAK